MCKLTAKNQAAMITTICASVQESLAMQNLLFEGEERLKIVPLKGQLLKWIGNKHRFAHEIVSYFPAKMDVILSRLSAVAQC